jgi:hypothetical protein
MPGMVLEAIGAYLGSKVEIRGLRRDEYLRKIQTGRYGKGRQCISVSETVPEVHVAQVMNYLKATGLALGYVLNFGNTAKLQWQRVLISDNLIEEEIS